MFQASQNRRLCLLLASIALAFVALWFQMYRVQIQHHKQVSETIQRLVRRVIIVDAPRGDIRDRNGLLFAGSEPLVNIYANTTLTRYCPWRLSQMLSKYLDVTAESILLNLAPIFRGFDEQGEWIREYHVLIGKNVLLEKWNLIQQDLQDFNFGIDNKENSQRKEKLIKKLRHRAIYAVSIEGRTYPNGHSFSQGLGFASYFDGTRRVGLRGIECTMESILSGKQGLIDTLVDLEGNEIPGYRKFHIKPIPGNHVYLTVDLTLQKICDEALANAMMEYHPTNAFAIMMQPHTGEILALSSLPDYCPADIGECPSLWRNPIVESVYEPGSTFKVITIAAAIETGAVKMDDVIYCENGIYRFEKCRPMHDVHPYRYLTVAEVLAKSSNIGTAKIALRIGPEKLYTFIQKFGFGMLTGVMFPSEVPGKVKALNSLTMEDKTRIPIGYSISVTPMQMVLLYCAIANGGWLVRPQIIHHLTDGSGKTFFIHNPEKLRQVISECTSKKMIDALKLTVSAEGTARLASLDQYETAGKTGTARKTVTINKKTTYDSKLCLSSFIGFLSADNPSICLGVFLDGTAKNLTGGKSAAAVFKEIGDKSAAYLRLKPDKQNTLHLAKF